MIERESKVRNQESEGREKRAAFARKQRVVDRLFLVD
jgi:hypothetical protein